MIIGSDGIKGTLQAVVSKVRQPFHRKPEQKKCECEIKVSVSAKQMILVVPGSNISISMNIIDIMNAMTAANKRFQMLRTQENFKAVMNDQKNGDVKNAK